MKYTTATIGHYSGCLRHHFRIVKTAIDKCKDEGINVGLIKYISLCPFPYEVFESMPTGQVTRFQWK